MYTGKNAADGLIFVNMVITNDLVNITGILNYKHFFERLAKYMIHYKHRCMLRQGTCPHLNA